MSAPPQSTDAGSNPPLLPFPERMAARIVLFLAVRLLSWEYVKDVYRREGERIIAVAKSLSPDQLRKRVDVGRMWGVFPGSQDWSAALIVQHLLLLQLQFARIQLDLSFNRVPKVTIDLRTAMLDAEYSGDVIDEFVDALDDFAVRLADEIGDTDSAKKFLHPALGPLDCRAWNVVAAVTHWCRRRQMERLAQLLAAS